MLCRVAAFSVISNMAVLTDEEEDPTVKQGEIVEGTEELANETLDAVEANKGALNKFVKEWINRMSLGDKEQEGQGK